MVWKPRATVAAICEKNEHFLMVEEVIHGQTCFNQPAGHLDDNESLVAAVARECVEETAYQFTPQALVGIYRWRRPSRLDTFLRATFCGHCSDQPEDQAIDQDIHAVHWMTINDIRKHADQLRSPMILRSFDDYLAGKRYPLELLVNVE